MSTSLLYHAFGLRGYDYVKTDYADGAITFTLHQRPHTCCCSRCGSREVFCRGYQEGCAAVTWVGNFGRDVVG
jgi:hypothetical protein